ncbi:MAG: serine/threonine protein kinase [Sandaracinaceae bacterium]|nr:serine/threonine protein kinase [Sandaracinaceae bacterium]
MGERAVPIQASGETPLGPKLPLRLGRFTLCAELGAGGMATVYLSRMQLAAGLERLVALKTIHPHLAKERAFIDMFLDEARIASHVTHPNVCSTHDFGEVDGVYYLAMEYLLGEPVFDVINRLVERFDDVREVLPYLAARIVADACEGLHAAHVARGPDGEQLHIVHRDVSPQNLFLTYEGSVKVVDFGCAKAAERVAHTSTGVVKGKVGYAAPEQIKGRACDARADVWALGVVLWETLTLSPLFTRETAVSTAMAVLDDEIELASDGRDWVPREVAEIAQKALSRDVAGRYQSARDLGRVLRKFIADSGYTLESAELAEWMDFLFEEQKSARIEEARRVREMDVSAVATARLREVTEADVESLGPAERTEAVVLPDDADDDEVAVPEVSGPMPRQRRALHVAEPTPLPVAPRSHLGRWLALIVLLLGLAAGGYYLHLHYEMAPWFLDLIGRDAPSPGDGEAAEGSERAGRRGRGDRAARTGDERAGPEAPAPDAVADPASAPSPSTEAPTPAAVAEGPTEPAPPEAPAPAPRRRSSSGAGVVTTVISGGGTTYVTEPPPAPVAPRASTGRLSIRTTSGWAEIYLDGRSLGRTPIDREVPEGTHRIRVLPYGRADGAETMVVDVSAAAVERITLDVDASP